MADNTSNYYGDLVVTTTFSVDHPNYIGRHLRFRRIGNNILIIIILGVIAVAFYISVWLTGVIACILVALGAGIWLFFNERAIREINKDLESEPKEVEGIIKVERERLKPGHYPYPGGIVILENFNDMFKVDVTFVRRISKGQRVRFIYTPKLKFIKAWQLLQ